MTSENEEKKRAASSPEEKTSSSSSLGRSPKPGKERDDAKEKEKSRKSRSSHPATTPGAVASTDDIHERRKEGRSGNSRENKPGAVPSTDDSRVKHKEGRSRTSRDSKPGAVASTDDRRERRKEGRSGGSSVDNKPGAVASTDDNRVKQKEGRNGGRSRNDNKPAGAVASTGRDSRKGSSGKSDGKSSGSSRPRTNRPVSDEKAKSLAATPSLPVAKEPEQDVEPGIVAAAVDEEQVFQEMHDENEALRQALERTKQAQANRQEEEEQPSTRRGGVPFWRSKTCIALTLAVAAAAALAAYFLTGEKNEAGSTASNNVDTGSNVTTTPPTTASPTTSPPADGDGQDIFQPPSSEVCSKVSEGLPVNGQDEMNIVQPVLITMNVYLLADIQRDLWLPGMADLYLKKYVVSPNPNGLKELVEGAFQDNIALVINGKDESSRAIKDIRGKYIQFSYNRGMSGSIPSFVTDLTELTVLGIGDTGRIGSIPSDVSALTNLRHFRVWGNYLTGTIPSGFSLMTDLDTFHVGYNNLSGSIPAEFGSMTKLTDVRIEENYLTGAIPSLPSNLRQCNLAMDGTYSFMLTSNKAEGNCFTNTANAPSNCNLSANQCALEATLWKFAPFDGNKGLALDWLKADTWEPPANAADETALWEERFVLAVFYYATTGDGWSNNAGWLTSADVCTWTGIRACNGDGLVTEFQLAGSAANGNSYGLVGDFPDEMRALSNLEYIQFSYNRGMSGSIPSFVTALTKLTVLGIGDTGRIGSIPSDMSALTNLRHFRVWGNYLTGTIPSGFSSMTDLDTFVVPYNNLSGSIPAEFGSMTKLTDVRIDENYLTGAIPSLPSNLRICDLAMDGTYSNILTSNKAEGTALPILQMLLVIAI